MKVYYIKDRSIIYILIAIVCLIIVFLGIKIISNIQYDESTQKTIDVVEVFNRTEQNIENKVENENINKEHIENPSFFMQLISRSNSFIRSMYNEKYNHKTMLAQIKETLVEDIQINRKLLKSQLPAIISTTNLDGINLDTKEKYANRGGNIKDISQDGLETINGLEIESSYSPLGDIAFIDDETGDEAIPVSGSGISKEEALEVIKNIERPKTLNVSSNNSPYVMIYHTHATEAYLPKAEVNYRSQDKNYNVIGIGDIVGEELAKKGHGVTHIETLHDFPNYNESYSRSLATIKEQMNKNKNLNVLLDIHRDGVTPDTSYYNKVKKESVIEIDGKKVGTFRFVIGNDTPNKDEILLFSNYIKSVSDMLYPGLCLSPIIKPYGKYNQYLSDYTLLLEVGSNINDMKETKATARYIAEILDVALKGIIN